MSKFKFGDDPQQRTASMPMGASPSSYATAQDYADYVGVALAELPADIDAQLGRATEEVDNALIASCYQVDDFGLPVQAVQLEAVRDAVCAIVQGWQLFGDELETLDQYQTVKIGSASLTKGARQGSAASPIGKEPTVGGSARAYRTLHTAGLLPGRPGFGRY